MKKTPAPTVGKPLLASDLQDPRTWSRFLSAARRVVHSFPRLDDFDSSHHAEELAQDAMVRAHVYLSEGGEIKDRDAFLYTTLRNLYKDRLKRQGRRPRTVSLGPISGADEADAEPLALRLSGPEALGPDQQARVTELLELVYRCLPDSRRDRRLSVLMLSLYGCTGRDMSAIVGRSPGTISGDKAAVRAAIEKALRILESGSPAPERRS